MGDGLESVAAAPVFRRWTAVLDASRARGGYDITVGSYTEMPSVLNGREVLYRVVANGRRPLIYVRDSDAADAAWRRVTPDEGRALRFAALHLRVPHAEPSPSELLRLEAAAPEQAHELERQLRARQELSENVDAFKTGVLGATESRLPGWRHEPGCW